MITYIGPPHPLAKLTEAQVVEMREARAAGAAYVTLARDFGISAGQVSRITQGFAWKHVGGPITFGQHSYERPVDPWFLAASMGLSWESAKLLAS